MSGYPITAFVEKITRGVCVLIVLLLIMQSQMASAQFVVDESADLIDFDLSDNICSVCFNVDENGDCTQPGGCTLVAAIQNANLSADINDIGFSVSLVQTPNTQLPEIIFPVRILGDTGSGRVHIAGPGPTEGAPGLLISGPGANGTQIFDVEISGYPNGIWFRDSSSGVVRGCYIHDNQPSGRGILVSGTSEGVLIGGGTDTPGVSPGNVISGNGRGISLEGGGDNLVFGNLIGFDEQGQAKPNTTGIVVGTGAGMGTLIGGDFENQRNVISNSQFSGIEVSGTGIGENEAVTGLKIRGNYIGTDVTGTQPFGNLRGIVLSRTDGIEIGGEEPTDRNLISGNGDGIWLNNNAMATQVVGNTIGLDVNGSSLPNGNGLVIRAFARENLVRLNVISGNTGDGIVITKINDLRPSSNTVELNSIGLDRDRNFSDVGNGGSGIRISDSDANTIKFNGIGTNGQHGLVIEGAEASADNVVQENMISANEEIGLLLDGSGVTGTLIENNIIGRGPSGLDEPGNQVDGLVIRGGQATQIGGFGAENMIASNEGSGLVITGASAARNTFSRNEIFDNGVMDVDLGDDLTTSNDLGDLVSGIDDDEGPNGLLNFPVGVTGFQFSDVFRISGVVHAPDPMSIKVDVFASDEPNPLGYGGGEIWLGEAVPDSGGVFFLDLDNAPQYPFLSALATDDEGNTSEFSPVCGDPDGDGNPDSDGDSLCDDWEGPRGIDYDGDGNMDLDLAAMGAKPDRKDLFLEVDWMQDGGHSHEPDSVSLAMAINMFAASPINNLDGSTGIGLHIQKDEAVPEVTPILFNPRSEVEEEPAGSFNDLKLGSPMNPCGEEAGDGHFGTKTDRGSEHCAAMLGARRLVYRYVIFGHDHAHTPGSSGIGELPGNDFMVTVGWDEQSFLYAGGFRQDAVAQVPVAKQRVEAATLVHEMGHTLNRGHGGVDGENCKPNYPSVMSYALQFQALVPPRVMDYSRRRMPSLDENALNEPNGLQGPANRLVVYNSSQGRIGHPDSLNIFRARTNQRPVDWDGIDRDKDGDIFNDNPALSDINYVMESCGDPGLSVLRGSNDWANLLYGFRFRSNFSDGVQREAPDTPPTPELTPADIADMAENFDYDGDGLMNAFDNCSAIANPDQEDLNEDGVGDVCEGAASDLGMNIDVSPDPGEVFDDLTYTFTIHNYGPDDATDITVAIEMDEAMSFVSSEGDICTETEGVVDCSAGNLAVGDSTMVVAVVKPTEKKTVSVTATISSLEQDPLPDDNTQIIETVVTIIVGLDDVASLPDEFRLGPAYPNPFNPAATIPFDVAQRTRVTLKVFNVLGQQVQVLEDGVLAAGRYERVFDARDLPSGIYFFSISMGDFSKVGRMVLMK